MSKITVQMQVSDAFGELGYSDEELRTVSRETCLPLRIFLESQP